MKVESESEVAHLCQTLSDPMDCSLPGSSIYGIFQETVMEWCAIVFLHFSFNSLSICLIFGCAGSLLLCVDFSLVVASGGCSLIVVRGLFVAVTSVVEHGLQ